MSTSPNRHDTSPEEPRQGEPSLDAAARVDACSEGCTPAMRADVLTQRNDASRTGANLFETVLTPATVAGLHELFRIAVDGEIYAQPLYAHAVAVEAGTKNLLFVATMEDTVYAFDADTGEGPVWQNRLGNPTFSARNVGGNNGILSTPVIDRSSETMYVSVRDCQAGFPPEAPHCTHRLVALDIRDGGVLRSIAIEGQIVGEAGAVTFDPNEQWNRAALLLAGGRVYVAFTAGPNGNQHEEDFIYHGWIFGYRADRFELPPSIYCSTRHGWGGGIWQSGSGLVADGDSVYFSTGNSVIAQTVQPPSFFPERPVDEEDSLVRLTDLESATPIATSYHDDRAYQADGNVFQYMESYDVDLSAGGPLLIPDTNQLVVGGKSGVVYNVDRNSMRAAQDPLSVFTSPMLAAGQTLYVYAYGGNPEIHGAPAFWRPASGPDEAGYGLVYLWPSNDKLKALRYDYGSQRLAPLLEADSPITAVGGVLSVSANRDQIGSGILWATSSVQADTTGHLFAFHAETLALLWDADIPHYAKWVPPTVVNGRVFVADSTANAVDARGVIAFGL